MKLSLLVGLAALNRPTPTPAATMASAYWSLPAGAIAVQRSHWRKSWNGEGSLMEQGTLLRRLGQCDATALAQVYDDYFQRIYRYIYDYLGREAAAEDGSANVFFRLLGAVRSGNSPRSNLSAWMYRVANNSVMDVFRRMPPEELELTNWLERTGSDPAHAAERHIEMERVRVALRELTEGQQQVIVLKFLQGMDSSEIGATMGRSEGAVDALQQGGMRALRRALQQQPS